MSRQTYKIFKDTERNLIPVQFNLDGEAYYTQLKKERNSGKEQFLITSDLMIRTIIKLLSRNKKNHLKNIELYDSEDSSVKEKIYGFFSDFECCRISELEIHDKLGYLESRDSIDLAVVVVNNEEHGEVNLKSNGIFEFFDDFWIDEVMSCINEAWV